MADVSILVPNYSKATFQKLLREYPNYPQELVGDKSFIVRRFCLHVVPTFWSFDVEFNFWDGVVGVFVRNIVRPAENVSPQLEDKVSFFSGDAHLGSTRAFKVIDTDNPFRLIESEIVNREFCRNYLASICHLAAYFAKVEGKGLDLNMARVLNYAASVAVVTRFCMDEENGLLAVRCRDIVVNPLLRRKGEPLQSVEIGYAGQR